MAPFCVDVQHFTATYTDAGQASGFVAQVRAQSGAAAGTDQWSRAELQVNDPLRMDGERLYLLGHGFTPHFQITYPGRHGARLLADRSPRSRTTRTSPRRARSRCSTRRASTGDEVRKQQLAIVGIFAPTALLHGGIMTSSFPAPDNPGVAVDVYRGDLGMEGGRSQSVFSIDTSQVDKGLLTKQARANLMLGRVDHPRRRHPDHLHRLQRVGLAADLLRPGAGVGAGLRGDAAGRPDGRRWCSSGAGCGSGCGPSRCPMVRRGPADGPGRAAARAGRRTVPWWRSAGWPAPTRQDTARNSPRWPCLPAGSDSRPVRRQLHRHAQEWVSSDMNETWAHISDLAFEAALAGYVVALVCYAIEFASRRGGDVPGRQAVGVAAGAVESRAAAPRR